MPERHHIPKIAILMRSWSLDTRIQDHKMPLSTGLLQTPSRPCLHLLGSWWPSL